MGKQKVWALAAVMAAVMAATSGEPRAESMIVGGRSILITEAPWQLLFNINGSGGCGASWIGGRWAVTAGHCVKDGDPARSYVFAGITSSDKEATTANRVAIEQFISSPLYAGNGDADIALIKLKVDITATKARPVPMATPAHAKAGLTNKGVLCMASGWGFMDPKYTKSPDTLRAVESKIYDTSKYVIRWAGNGVDTVGSCMGDSGGPLVVKDANGNWILAGVSSSIPGGGATLICGNPNGPPNYTRVSAFYDWILAQTGPLPVALGGRPDQDFRIAFPGPGQFRLSAPQMLETALFDLSGARVGRDRRYYAAGIHAIPVGNPASGRYVVRIKGEAIDIRREIMLLP